MNELIEKLAEQAMAKAVAKNFTGEKFELRMPSEAWAKEFAELIVRECMRESMEEIVSDEDIASEEDPLIREYLNGNNQGIVDAVVRFRNHFGVEE